MTDSSDKIEQLAVNTIRTLCMDAVQAANSGHPGTPMALAPAAYVLFNEVLNFDPAVPNWPGRDRFVLSCGHASTLLFSTLHLCGVKQLDADGKPTSEAAVPLESIRQFRQLGSRCPGHPEHATTSGVETTTGPLGQGISNSVGMAIAAEWLAAKFNRPGFELFGFNAYAICSDGDLMEGVGSEAASIAGHLKLSNLCWIYDDNKITIEGDTSLAFSESVASRFSGYGWNVLEVEDINDLDALRGALGFFSENNEQPTLIITHTVIGYGSPNKAGTAPAHGSPLGDDEIKLTKASYGWPEDEKFLVPEEVMTHFADGIGARGSAAREAWEAKFAEYKKQYPEEAAQLDMIAKGTLPDGWDADMKPFPADAKGMASRVSSGKVLNQLAKNIPWMLGGSADLSPSNNSDLKFDGAGEFSAEDRSGRNFHFGIREHAMGAICNGMALCGLRSYGATFFVFTDYMRPPMRLAALMGLPVLNIFTHDSIGVGEDGPTHQPVEHLAALRSIPNMLTIRPADANEVSEAYKAIAQLTDKPASLVLTRQNLPTLDRTKCAAASGTQKGGYVLLDAADGKPQVILIATGSEVSICAEAHEKLTAEGMKVRVVSLPCWELFEQQDAEYRDSVLPPSVTKRVGVEMGVRMGWERYIGDHGKFIGMSGYGVSGPAGVLLKHFGFTVENIIATAKSL